MQIDESFTITVNITGAKTFAGMPVVGVKATEGFSQPYRISVELITPQPANPGDVDLEQVLQEEYGIVFARKADEAPIHGVVALAEHLGATQDLRQRYRIELVPQLWFGTLARRTRAWRETKLTEVIKDVLRELKVDVEMKTSGAYEALAHITQYEETDFDFISRLMEQEGMVYWFEFKKDSHRMVIGDSANAHPPTSKDLKVQFDLGDSAQGGEDSGTILSFSKRHVVVPKEVTVREYNPQHPSTPSNTKKSVKGKGIYGTIEESNYHVLGKPEDAGRYAQIRTEEYASHRLTYVGTSGVAAIHAGVGIDLKGSDAYEGNYVITEVSHEWKDAGGGEAIVYHNSFKALDRKQLPWRAPRVTPIPRISGLVTGKILTTAGHQNDKELDGSYRVGILNESSNSERVIRLAQPYAGPSQGIHFPLPPDTEVVLGHLNGHPDRPIIAGALPNVENPSPVVEDNKTQCVVKSATGAILILEDKKDEEHIHLGSSKGHVLKLDDTKGNEKISMTSKDGHGLTFHDKEQHIALVSTKGNSLTFDDQNEIMKVDAKKDFDLKGAGTGKMTFKEKLDVDGDDEITITAKKKITLKVGSATIVIDSNGKIAISGTNIDVKGTADAKIGAPKVDINGDGTVTVKGGVIQLN